MAAAPPPQPLLPVTNPSSSTGGGSVPAPSSGTAYSDSALATPALRHFLTNLSHTARRSLSDRRPWAELLDRTALSRPDSLAEATSRLRRNVAYFRVNYAALVALSLAASLLAHPFSLLVLLALLAAWCSLYFFRAPDQPPVVLLGRAFTDRQTLLALLVASLLAFFLTSVASLIVSGLLVGAALVAAHGAFRVPEDLFLDDSSAVSGGNTTNRLLSFLASPGSGV